MGAAAVGGRGGSVCIVDTLSDSAGDGQTFRECVESSGARYVTFEVSGIIDLVTNLTFSDPYITIAGQTSPGGVMVTGRPTYVNTHDVIIQHMRWRTGQHRLVDSNDADAYGDAFAVIGDQYNISVPAYNIIIDHCSFGFGVDEVVNVAYNVQDTTFSWCKITHGITSSMHPESPHSMGFFVWGSVGGGVAANPAATVSLHHSFLGFAENRMPENSYNSFLDSVNNVVYYWNTSVTHQVERVNADNHSYANIIGSYRKINTSVSTAGTRSAFVLEYASLAEESIYMTGVLDGYRDSQVDPQWSAQEYWHVDQSLSTDWQKATPWATTGYSGDGIPVVASTMDATYASSVVADSGATKCQSDATCSDSVDSGSVSHYEAGTGAYVTGAEVDSLDDTIWPEFLTPAAPADTDNDGMSDAWETSTFGDLDQTATGDQDVDGYDNLEEYIHFLGNYIIPDTTAPVTTASPAAGTYHATQSVALSCTDAVGCTETLYCAGADCTPDTTYTAPVSTATTTTYCYASTDAAANPETKTCGTWTIETATLNRVPQIGGRSLIIGGHTVAIEASE